MWPWTNPFTSLWAFSFILWGEGWIPFFLFLFFLLKFHLLKKFFTFSPSNKIFGTQTHTPGSQVKRGCCGRPKGLPYICPLLTSFLQLLGHMSTEPGQPLTPVLGGWLHLLTGHGTVLGAFLCLFFFLWRIKPLT